MLGAGVLVCSGEAGWWRFLSGNEPGESRTLHQNRQREDWTGISIRHRPFQNLLCFWLVWCIFGWINDPLLIVTTLTFFVLNSLDPASTFCSAALHPPEGTVNKPQCEINPFNPQASMVKWAAPLTASAQSPIYLHADWFSVAAQGLNKELTLANVMRAPSGSKEPSGKGSLLIMFYTTWHYSSV